MLYQIPPPTKPLVELETVPEKRDYSWSELAMMIGNPLQYLADIEYDAAFARLESDGADLFTDGQHFYTIGSSEVCIGKWALFGVRMEGN